VASVGGVIDTSFAMAEVGSGVDGLDVGAGDAPSDVALSSLLALRRLFLGGD
jgi:hypothetical protein